MNELTDLNKYRILVLKGLIKGLNTGLNSDEVSRRFSEILRDTTPEEVVIAEEELIYEGVAHEKLSQNQF